MRTKEILVFQISFRRQKRHQKRRKNCRRNMSRHWKAKNSLVQFIYVSNSQIFVMKYTLVCYAYETFAHERCARMYLFLSRIQIDLFRLIIYYLGFES